MKERSSPLPGGPNVGEWFVLRQGTLRRKVRTQGARERLATPLERPGEGPREVLQWRHGEFTQVQATLRCNTLLLLSDDFTALVTVQVLNLSTLVVLLVV